MNEVKTSREKKIIQLVTFKIGSEEYAVDIFKVREIENMKLLTKLPNSPDFVEGIMNLRSNIVPVVSLRAFMGMPKKEISFKTSIIVSEIGGKIIGFIVDEVNEVLRIDNSIIEDAPELSVNHDSHFIIGIAKLDGRLIILLNLDVLKEITNQINITKNKEKENEVVL